MTDRPSPSPAPAFPAGLQTLVALAAASPEAADALLRDREAFATASGLPLTATERAILGGIPEPALRRALAGVGPSLPDRERRALLELAAATLAGLAVAGAAAPGAGAAPYEYRPPAAAPLVEAKPTGIRPDYPHLVVVDLTVTPGRPAAAYRRVVLHHGPALVSLYRRLVWARDRYRTVDLHATLDLSPAGKVLAVTGVGVQPAEDQFRDEVVAVLRRIEFPASGPKRCEVLLSLRFLPR